MKESVLKSLMRLFAIVSQVHSIEGVVEARKVVASYLVLVVRPKKVKQYLIMYDFYHNNLRERENKTGDKQLSLLSVKAMIICENANKYLTQKQKILVFTHVLEVLVATEHKELDDVDFVKSIATALKLDDSIFSLCFAFVFNDFNAITEKEHILMVGSKTPYKGFKYLPNEFLKGQLIFLYIKRFDVCLFKMLYHDDQFYFNDNKVELSTTYIFEKGSMLKSPFIGTLYYNDIIKRFLYQQGLPYITFEAKGVDYIFNDGQYGIYPFNFKEDSGQLIGVMGGSGVGKSTLINLLNGNLAPSHGYVLLNGYNVHTEKEKLHGYIGYVPQDDYLIEELTVFENLNYSAQLCFKDDSTKVTLRKVNKVLSSLELNTVKGLKVGSPLNNLISGGQRKRLNIALELIREPYVLFVDEPTSGLSSTDSFKVMDLLKHQSLRGKLVIVNIHQPSSDIFKQFDKLLLLDTGGRVVFHGKPQDALIYLKKYNQLVNAEEGECPSCGNLNPEQILDILESKKVNEYGEYSKERLLSPEIWYKNYAKTLTKVGELVPSTKVLPKISFSLPGNFKQFKIFNIRNILTKFSDKQFFYINLLEAPVLAFILSWFTRYSSGADDSDRGYVFFDNINIPVYIFMSVIVAIFFGLMVSAEDIIRDRKILKREAFLQLNRNNYYNAKIFLLAIILAFQTLSFVLVGNSILHIKGMLFYFWPILWLVAMVAGMAGMNISATLKSVVSIYILIPILLVPQILLGGAMIKFDKLNNHLSKEEYVPLIGDVMPSRWGYEALMVTQFTKNKYQKLLLKEELEESIASYNLNYYIPELRDLISDVKMRTISRRQDNAYLNRLHILSSEIEDLKGVMPGCFDEIEIDDIKNYNISTNAELEKAINCTRLFYIHNLKGAIQKKDNQISKLENEVGGRKELLKLRNQYSNNKVNEIVLDLMEKEKVRLGRNGIIRRTEPIYHYPENNFGRAHFFSPVKKLGNYYIETFWFNALVLCVMIFVFYLLLIFELFPKLAKQLDPILLKGHWIRIVNEIKNLRDPMLK